MPLLGFAFQILFNAVCISPKMPDAVTSSVATPINVASMPDDLPAALAIAVCRTSAVCCPIRPDNWAMIAFWAAS